jgi:hypothetical protein
VGCLFEDDVGPAGNAVDDVTRKTAVDTRPYVTEPTTPTCRLLSI